MAKITDYAMAYNPRIRKGTIRFREQGNGTPVLLADLPAEEFLAIAAVLQRPNAFTHEGWIHTGPQYMGMLAETDFDASHLENVN
jgi:hypothetical protein